MKILVENRTVDDLEDKEIHRLTMHTGENHIEQFEGALADILGELVPDISDFAKNRILRNSYEHQENLQSLIDRSHSVESAGRELVEKLVNMAKRFG